MTYPGKPIPSCRERKSFPVGDMPGAVNVNRSSFDVELPNPPLKSCGGRGETSDSVPDCRTYAPVHAPDLSRRKATLYGTPLAIRTPNLVHSHSPPSSKSPIGRSNPGILPNGNLIASYYPFDPAINHNRNATTLAFVSKDGTDAWRRTVGLTPPYWDKRLVHRDRLSRRLQSG